MPKIFLSYRRADSAETTNRLYDRLVYAFGRESVFKDVDTLQRGDDFPEVLRHWVNTCDVFLSIIGQHWLSVQDEAKRRRLDNPQDWVRQETEMALGRGSDLLLLPLIVDGASLPKTEHLPETLTRLTDRNNQSLQPARFHDDVSDLITFLRRHFGLVPPAPSIDPQRALRDLADRLKAGDLDAARDILAAMRAQGNIPAQFRLEAVEKSLYRQVQEKDRDRAYYGLQPLADLAEGGLLPPEEVIAALQEFWQTYPEPPGYDPLTFARFQPPASPSLYTERGPGGEVAAALHRAGSFMGKRNRDWQPFVATFPDLKIPDMSFCLVPVGSFQMGSDDGHYDDEQPLHPQTIKQPYWIAQYPVTNTQWALAVKAKAVKEPYVTGDALKWYKDPKMANAPVVGVDWFMARDFAAWLGCRLPSECEWEYAARGVESLSYPWGDDWNEDIPVWSKNSGGKPAAVTTKPEGASWVDARHLIGNVWEWTNSLYQPYPYAADDREGDTVNSTDVLRVLRGGSWFNFSSDLLRVAVRYYYNPVDWYFHVGFRCARS